MSHTHTLFIQKKVRFLTPSLSSSLSRLTNSECKQLKAGFDEQHLHLLSSHVPRAAAKPEYHADVQCNFLIIFCVMHMRICLKGNNIRHNDARAVNNKKIL